MNDPNVIVTEADLAKGAADAGERAIVAPCPRDTWCVYAAGHDGECRLDNRPAVRRSYVGPATVGGRPKP